MRDFDVGRLQVAVNDAALVRVLERFRNLLRDGQRFFQRDRAFPDPVGERRPFNRFHHQCTYAAAVFEVVDGSDVSLVEGCENLRLTLKARHKLCVPSKFLQNHFQRNISSQFRIRSAIYRAHSAGTERRSNFIRSEFGPSSERHSCA